MIECNSYDALKTGIMDFQEGKQMSQANDHDVFELFVHSVILEDAPSVSVSSNNVKPFVTKSKSGIRLK